VQISDNLLHRASCPIVNLEATLVLATGVLGDVVAVQRTREASCVGVGVASKVGQDVTHGPPRQQARRADVLRCHPRYAVHQARLGFAAQLRRPLRLLLQIHPDTTPSLPTR
jgi:hypothetical protein